MNIEAIVRELKAERDRLDGAIAALDGRANGRGSMTARPARRQMSAAARRRISEGMKRRWASGKMGKRKAKTA